MRRILGLFAAVAIALSTPSDAAKRRGRKRGSEIPIPEPEPVERDVFTRGLVSRKLPFRKLIAEHRSYLADTSRRSFEGDSLAFVTPWNGLGYDMAKLFAGKWTYVSPVWLQVRRGDDGDYVVTGGHDIDEGWLADVRRVCADPSTPACPRIVPRVALEAPVASQADQARLVGVVADFLERRGFDGAVFEMAFHPTLLEILDKLAAALHARRAAHAALAAAEREVAANGEVTPAAGPATTAAGAGMMHLVAVLPPSRPERRLAQGVLARIARAADRIVIMTYDHSVHSGAGPNAPLPWVRSTLEDALGPEGAASELAARVLLGLAFYGYDERDAVVGRRFVELLARYRPRLRWDAEAEEHFVQYKEPAGGVRTVYYPTPASIHRRLELADEMGTGVAVWEIGQGMECFFDLL